MMNNRISQEFFSGLLLNSLDTSPLLQETLFALARAAPVLRGRGAGNLMTGSFSMNVLNLKFFNLILWPKFP